MRRTKEWWARLNPNERAALVWLEHAKNLEVRESVIYGGLYVCPACGVPTADKSLCLADRLLLGKLLGKANGECP